MFFLLSEARFARFARFFNLLNERSGRERSIENEVRSIRDRHGNVPACFKGNFPAVWNQSCQRTRHQKERIRTHENDSRGGQHLAVHQRNSTRFVATYFNSIESLQSHIPQPGGYCITRKDRRWMPWRRAVPSARTSSATVPSVTAVAPMKTGKRPSMPW